MINEKDIIGIALYLFMFAIFAVANTNINPIAWNIPAQIIFGLTILFIYKELKKC